VVAELAGEAVREALGKGLAVKHRLVEQRRQGWLTGHDFVRPELYFAPVSV